MKDFETDKYEDASGEISGERGMQLLCGMHLAVSLHNLEEKLRVMAIDRVMNWPDSDQLNEVIPDLVKHPLPMVRAAVAAHSETAQDFIELLAIDSDPTVRAAIIRNPSAPESVREKLSHDQEVVSLRKNSNKKGGCFIATVVYEDEMAPEVMLLRYFRDQWLLPRVWGRAFVAVYYKVSPSIAQLIGRHEWTKLVIRQWLLDPVVRIIHQKFSD